MRFLHIPLFPTRMKLTRWQKIMTDHGKYEMYLKFSIRYFQKSDSPSNHLAADTVIILFKGRAVFRQYIPKKDTGFSTKVYELCDSTGNMYDMKVYLEKGKQHTAQDFTPAHATERENFLGKWKDEVTNCIWIISSSLLHCLMT
jgi:hypothetical protein